MRQLLSDNIKKAINSTTIALAAIVVLIFHSSCKGDSAKTLIAIECSDSIAVMTTFDVNTIVSDSGRISYKIIADEWLMFEKLDSPFWAFERGAYLEKYDDSLNIEATIKSDTAYFFSDMKLWKLIGNVDIKNQKGETTEIVSPFW
jgi:hypothetical protein